MQHNEMQHSDVFNTSRYEPNSSSIQLGFLFYFLFN